MRNSPGGSAPPLRYLYAVTAQFTSADPNYTNSTGTGTVTITDSVPLQTVAPAGNLLVGRVSHQSTVLANGFVLASGGQHDGAAVTQAELFNPTTSSWSLTGSSIVPRFDHSATLLLDGRVLAVGGVSAIGDCSSNATAEAYDPARGKWSLTGRLPAGRHRPYGNPAARRPRARCRRWRPVRLRIQHGSTLRSVDEYVVGDRQHGCRQFHSAAPLQDGRVLVAGGVRGSPATPDASAEIYDPAVGTWTAATNMGTARQTSCNGECAAVPGDALDGAVLAAGGFSGANCSTLTPNRTITDIIVSPSSVQLNALGRTQALTVTAQLSDGSSQRFTGPLQFASADAAVASVDDAGVVAARGAGRTTITATPSGFAPIAVETTVVAAHLTSISVSPPAITFIGSGQVRSLAVNGLLSDGSQQLITTGLTFSSSNPAVVAIDQAGLVTSGADGISTLSVATSGIPPVQVPILVKSLVSISSAPQSLTLTGAGQTRTL